MENKIPLPTDSIYKFYALLGLLLFIFCLGSTIYVSRSTNDLIFTTYIELETLKTVDKPTPVEIAKREGIERRVEIAVADKESALRGIGFVCAIGLFMMGYGFLKWHRDIQPIQDETARLQLEKLRHEVSALLEKKEPK